MTSQLPNLDIYIKTLTEKVHVQLVMTMILEKVNLIVGHSHLAVIIFQTGLVNNQAAIGHHVFAEVGLFAFHSAGNAKIRPDLTASFHVLFGKVGGKGRFTSAGDSEVKRERHGLSAGLQLGEIDFHSITILESVDSRGGVRRAHAHPLFFIVRRERTADA